MKDEEWAEQEYAKFAKKALARLGQLRAILITRMACPARANRWLVRNLGLEMEACQLDGIGMRGAIARDRDYRLPTPVGLK